MMRIEGCNTMNQIFIFRKELAMKKDTFKPSDSEWLNYCNGKACKVKVKEDGKLYLAIPSPDGNYYSIDRAWCINKEEEKINHCIEEIKKIQKSLKSLSEEISNLSNANEDELRGLDSNDKLGNILESKVDNFSEAYVLIMELTGQVPLLNEAIDYLEQTKL